jgi:signal transduction histidine kinase
MRSFRLLAAVLLLCLSGFLCWAWTITFRAERQRISGEIELLVQRSADSIQRANVTDNNLVAFFADARKDEKLAFAIGMTGNRGKLAMSFSNSDSAYALEKDTAPKIGPEVFKARRIGHRPSLVATIRQFDTLIGQELKRHSLDLPYTVAEVPERPKQIDSAALRTPPFIVNFFDPTVYELKYQIPFGKIFGRLWPYTLSSAMIVLLVGGALLLFYRSLQAQHQINRFRSHLFSNATHELKTPLSSLQLIMDAFRYDEKTASVYTGAAHIDFAKTEIRRMNLLVNRILSFGRMTRAQLALDKTAVDLATIVQDAVTALTHVFRERKAAITVNISEHIVVKGDAVLLTNMLMTIIENAVKHTPGAALIEVGGNIEREALRISITDNGPGIPAAYRKRIFEPFIRMPESSARGIPGQGLGLSFAQQVAQIHGGDIIATDGPGGTGARFIITLPSAYIIQP